MATRTQLAAFDEVKKMISNLVADLKKKKADEVKKRDYCIMIYFCYNYLFENDKRLEI